MIALDLSRLLSRARCATPTGIDRVELAYARHLITGGRSHCFAARNAIGGIGLLPAAEAATFVTALSSRWRDGAAAEETRRIAQRLSRAALFDGERALRQELLRAGGSAVYLLVSHQNLDRARPIVRLKHTTSARFVCLIHDLIPLDLSDLTRPGQARRHRRRIAAAAALADAAIVNSAATRAALDARIGSDGRKVPIVVAPLATDLPHATTPADLERPYFVCIGTIEARKNHRLLLDLWQRLAAELGDQAPLLLLIGQRGFGSERVAGSLPDPQGLVREFPNLPDTAMATLLEGARALLLPSLAEGFGLPVIEALTRGVPVLCSDLPALRESGGGVPDYLDPADADAWRTAILDYLPDSPRRLAQLMRLTRWRAPCWADHFVIVERLIDELGARDKSEPSFVTPAQVGARATTLTGPSPSGWRGDGLA